MQEDKKFHSLLSMYAMQEPSAGFDEKVMQLVEASAAKRPVILVNSLLLRVLLGVFAITSFILLVVAFFIKPQIFTAYVPVSFTSGVYTQLFSFLVAFWIVMLANLWWNKRRAAIMN